MTFENKEIRGINIKQLLQYTAAIVAGAFVYFDLKNTSLRNREVLEEYKMDSKEYMKSNEIRLTNIEQQQKLIEIRLTVLETQLNK